MVEQLEEWEEWKQSEQAKQLLPAAELFFFLVIYGKTNIY